MAVNARWYSNGLKNWLAGTVDWDAHTVKVALLENTYTPSQAHEFFDDVSADESVGTGDPVEDYVAGGVALASKTNAQVLDTAASAWQAATVYNVGDVRRPTSANGRVYVCIVAGTSAGSAPTFPTISRQTVTDNTVTWAEAGSSLVVLGAADASWDPTSITARYAVVYRDTGTAATSPLLAYVDFGQDEVASNADFNIVWAGGIVLRQFAGS